MTKIRCRLHESTCVVDLDGRVENLQINLQRGLPVCTRLPERAGKLALCGAGPSLRHHVSELREWPGEVWAVNGAYSFLRDHGIVPHGFVAIDPLPGMAQYVENTDPATTFYIASICDPSVFDNLCDRNVIMFHPDGEDMQHRYPPDSWIVGGGTTVLTRAPYLGLLLGWRDFTVFGADSSYEGLQRYAYETGRFGCDNTQPYIMIEVNGEGPFDTEIGLMKQVSQLAVIGRHFGDMMKFSVGGLMDAFLRAPIRDDSDIELVSDDARADAA